MNVNMNESFFNFFRSLFENKLEKSDVLIEEKDVPEFLRIASSHQLVALTCKELSRQLPHNRYIKLYTNRFTDHHDKYMSSLRMMISLLGKNEIEYCLLKGYPLALQIYGNVHLRDAGDIDVLMSRENISKAFCLLKSMGYNQENHVESMEPVLDYNENFYEYKMIPSDGNWKPTIELKTGSGEISETVLDWRKYTRQIRISDMEITAPTQDYLLLHMFAKTFLDNEDIGVLAGFPAFRNYFELAYYLEYKYVGDFCEVVQLARECRVLFKISRVLRSLRNLFAFKNFDINGYYNLTLQNAERKYPDVLETIPEKVEVNGGVKTPSNIIVGPPQHRIQNLDLARYEYIKNHKIAVFSDLSPCFRERKVLKTGFTEWAPYKRFPELNYRFGSQEDVIIQCRINNAINHKWINEGKKIKIRWLDSNFFSISFFVNILIPINAKSTEYHSLSYDSTEVYSSEFVRDNAELITDPLVKYKVSRDSDDTYYTIRISKNGLFKEHKSVMYEIRLADSPNDTCPMEYEALQEIVTFD